MTDLGEVLARLGLSEYLEQLVEEGFEKWEAVMDITEQDLAVLSFKLGHRRVLQREIASARGVPLNQALTSTHYYPIEDIEQDERLSPKLSSKSDPGKGSIPPTGKRKYRRHPKSKIKPDERAPEKPPSAYVMFANRVRDDLKGQNLSFTDIAKLVGEKWKVLDPEHKEGYEHEASVAKEKYNSEMQEYKKTESYREYIQYLSEFKTKMSKEGREGSEQAEANRKRPKIEVATTMGSGGGFTNAGGSGARGPPVGISAIGPYVPRGGGAPGSGTATSSESTYTSPSSHDSSTTFHPLSVQSVSPSTAKPAASPPPRRSRSPSDVARYRDAVLRTTQQQQQEALVTPTTDAETSFFPRIHPTSHIQQPSSFVRNQHPIGARPSSRPGPPIPNPAMRRTSMRSDDTLPPTPSSMASSSGSSSAPSLTPSMSSFDDSSNRPHRSLPALPPPTQGQTSGPGYFDQRPHHSQPPPPRSPRPFSHHQNFPPPTPMGHPSHSTYHGYQSASQLPTIAQAAHESSSLSGNPTSGGIRQTQPKPKPPSGR